MPSNIDLSSLNGLNGFRLSGVAANDLSGGSVSSAGDVNGDGFDDLIVGAYLAGPIAYSYNGASYVVFGRASGFTSNLSLSTLDGANGFRLSGGAGNDYAGRSVSAAGDVNGDGFDDLIVGAPYADPYGGNSGASYVVFGKSSGFASNLDLASLDGANGFRLSGAAANDFSGRSVSDAGDVNGDGFGDLIVGAHGVASTAGASYVVFGMASGFASNLELSALNGTNGFRLSGGAGNDYAGRSVSAAGDVNGDGVDDLIVGANGADPNGSNSGASYVVFGSTSGFAPDQNLAYLDGSNGFRLSGVASNDNSGISVSGAGDVNGDGVDDLIVGANGAGPNGSYSGASYVVFGRASGFASSLNLSSLDGTNGFRFSGVAADDRSGYSVSGAGDVNGDGFDDLIVGAHRADPNAGYNVGESYVVYGKSSGFASNLNLSALDGTNGFRLSGAMASDYSGGSVSAAGDVNGDGFDDLIVGAGGADTPASFAGASYVIYGGNFTGAVTYLGGSGADVLTGNSAAETFVAGQGNDTIVGGGGADVFNAGAGDDRIVLASTSFALVDGGTGVDTLALSGSGQTLDVTTLANNRIDGIEGIDLTGSGSNTLKLSGTDVLALSESSNTLRVDGNGGDRVIGQEDWAFTGTTTIESQSYAVYTLGAATLQVDADVVFVRPNIQLSGLNGADGFRLSGVSAGDRSGWSVAAAGDVNGDGFDDLIVGAYRADPNGELSAGASYVVFGRSSGFASNLDLSALDGLSGFRLSGVAAADLSGYSVSTAGDVNGDGFADLIVGAYRASPNGGYSGASYVVFGGSSGFASNLNLSALDGANGFRLSGAAANDHSGISVSNAGDVNGDGFGDLIIGARYADPNGIYSGASYVVFGKASGFGANLQLSALDGLSGFRLSGMAPYDLSGRSVSAAGDVNGDGFADLIVGAPYADPNGGNSGASYVVFGRSSGFASNLDLSALDGTNGFRLSGVATDDRSGRSVSTAGDVNGDGFDDLIVGANGADPYGGYSGASYVVFGKASGFASNQDLSALDGANGFRLSGVAAYDGSGRSVSAAGDVNGDGFDDLIVGAPYANPNGYASGASYVVYGKASGFASNLDLSALDGLNGFRLAGVAAGDQSGISVSAAGDVNGDGFDDLIVGANNADTNGSNSGASYVIYGGNFTGSVTHQGTAGADTLIGTTGADVMLSGLGNDSLTGDAGNDVLRGGRSDDFLRGNQGADTLLGEDGNDQLFGDNGNDTIAGGVGADNVNGNNGFDTVDGGAGNDTIHGGTEADVLSGGNGDDLVFGDKANDTLDGGNGNDNVLGGIGNDWLAGGAGTDTLDGGTEVDTADYRSAPGAAIVDLLAGTASDGWGFTDTLILIENVTGSAFNDTLTGDLNANVLDGGAGDDSMLGGAGNDVVQGGLGNDFLRGNQGADTLVGDDGADQLFGDNGNDTIAGGLGDDNINGNNGFDTVDGGGGNDTIHGGTEADVLSGGDDDDQVFGDKANDTLDGGAGNDTIIGGLGNDWMDGGAGDDLFRYDATSLNTADVTANGVDVIKGAVAGDLVSLLGLNDELQIGAVALDALSSDAILGGALSAGTSVAFVGGVLEIDVNLDGAFNAADDFQITLTGVTTVTYNATDDLFHLA